MGDLISRYCSQVEHCVQNADAKDEKAVIDGVARIVTEAVRDPNLFVFGELLETNGVRLISKRDEFKTLVGLLELFAFGVYRDYEQQTAKFASLMNSTLVSKLRKLTILSLAASTKELEYGSIFSAVGLKDVRELEDLLIDCIYQGLLRAKLDPQKQLVHVEYSACRDVPDQHIQEMINAIQVWQSRASQGITALDNQAKTISIAQREEEERKRSHHNEIVRIRTDVESRMKKSSYPMTENLEDLDDMADRDESTDRHFDEARREKRGKKVSNQE